MELEPNGIEWNLWGSSGTLGNRWRQRREAMLDCLSLCPSACLFVRPFVRPFVPPRARPSPSSGIECNLWDPFAIALRTRVGLFVLLSVRFLVRPRVRVCARSVRARTGRARRRMINIRRLHRHLALRPRVLITVAILAQGTHWAVATSQAFLFL